MKVANQLRFGNQTENTIGGIYRRTAQNIGRELLLTRKHALQ